MRFKTLDDWLGWLESLHPTAIELGLDRVRQVAGNLPELSSLQTDRKAKVVAIAGTNGKGSCIAILENLCIAAGQSVGAYTSPHLLHYSERIRINGQSASDAQIMSAFEHIDAARGETSLTYFEFGTLAALLIFVRAGVDNLLLEVGLGGRLDAVNMVDSDIAVVTSVDLDHQDWLGNDRETIGREKAGIFRNHKHAICVDPDPPASLLTIAGDSRVDLLLGGRDISWVAEDNSWTWCGLGHDAQLLEWQDLPLPRLPLPSVAAALQAFELLGNSVSAESLTEVLKSTTLPGRCQQLQYRGKDVTLDVAHNPAAAAYLAERLRASSQGKTLAVFAVMADKDYESMLRALAPVVDRWFLGGLPGNPRAANPTELLHSLQALGDQGRSCDTVATAFAEALEAAREGDRVLVVGSFYTVAAVLAMVDSEK
ncbi:MAG: bifunctional tetrahydrofolate synthase/dihydrofolate synthase [Cellvibrionaceae bacterium]